VIGLLVPQAGFPLSYDVFAGNTFGGKTLLPVVEDFIAKHPDTKPTVVADAAMLDDDRLAELREKGLSYIVGVRQAKTDLGTVKKIHVTLNAVDGAITRLHSRHGDLICDFSTKRYRKSYWMKIDYYSHYLVLIHTFRLDPPPRVIRKPVCS
jgi:transposase